MHTPRLMWTMHTLWTLTRLDRQAPTLNQGPTAMLTCNRFADEVGDTDSYEEDGSNRAGHHPRVKATLQLRPRQGARARPE